MATIAKDHYLYLDVGRSKAEISTTPQAESAATYPQYVYQICMVYGAYISAYGVHSMVTSDMVPLHTRQVGQIPTDQGAPYMAPRA